MLAALCLLAAPVRAATNDLTSAIQRGLFEEEANQNLGAAIQAYQTVAGQFDKDRRLAATAIFRLGECYRKQGNTNDAAAQYERVLREFSDQPTLVTLSRQNLVALGSAPPAAAAPILSDAARQEQKRLMEEEIQLVQKQLDMQQKQFQAGVIGQDALFATQRDLLKLRRQVAALDAGQPASFVAPDTTAAAAEAEGLALEAQITELKALPQDKLRIAVQQNFPNPVLTSLMQKRTEAEQKLAELQKEFGPEHTEVVKAGALKETIDKQIDEQVQSILRYLEIKRTAASKAVEILRAQSAAPASPAKTLATGSAPVAPTSSEAEEVKRIQALIKDSPDLINARVANADGTTPLHSAAYRGQLVVAEFLLANGADVGAKIRLGDTPLHAAATSGHKSMVELLLNHQASVQAVDGGGATPLHLAAQHGYRSVVETLLAHAAEVNAKDKYGSTPFLLASAYGFKSVANLLLAHGADINATTSYIQIDGRNLSGTPLCIAATRGDQPLVELLLSKGAQANAKDMDGGSPLHLAADAGYPGIVELLLAKGADANAEDGNGRTPLSLAAQKPQVMQLLLAAHANPNAGRVNLPLARAAFEGDLPTLKLLLANGADPNTNSKVNWSVSTRGYIYNQGGTFTPLFLAVSQRHADAAKELLGSKANPNVTSLGDRPLLYWALPDAPTLKVLLEGGAKPNQSVDGTPLLLLAVYDKNQAAVELLLKAGADVKARNKNGNTPLHYAVGNAQRELAELLLANKADPNERNNAGQTPLDLAKSQAQPGQGLPPGAIRPSAVTLIPGGRPGSFQPQAAGTPGSAPAQESKPETMADLLRRHGAVDDLPQLDRIGVARRSTGYSATAFTKGAHDWGQFTLLELIGAQCGFLAGSPNDVDDHSPYSLAAFASSYRGWPFPDLAHLRVRRPAPDLKSWQEQAVDLRPVLESGDCSKDVRLEWGDMVEIPEADHPLNEKWPGFSKTELANLKKCLTRQVEIVINGQATNITLAPRISNVGEEKEAANATSAPGSSFSERLHALQEPTISAHTPFWLKPVLLQSKLVLTSSDLRHVKVTRRDSATGQAREWVVDCSVASPAPDFWLRDGDKVEVPERTDSASASEATLAPPSSAPPTSPQRPQRTPSSAPGTALPPGGVP